MDVPIFYPGAPFDFNVEMAKDIEAADTVSVLLWTYRFGRHLQGASDGDSDLNDVAVDHIEGPRFGVSVSGEKCRLLVSGFVHIRAVIKDPNGATKDVYEGVVAEIGNYYQPTKEPTNGND